MSKTLSLQDLSEDLSGALRAAEDHTVFLLEDGQPAYVLLSYPAWQALAAASPSILDRLAQKSADADSVTFNPEPVRIKLKPPAFD